MRARSMLLRVRYTVMSLVCAAGAIVTVGSPPAHAIVGGTPVDYPWAVALAFPSSQGGSIEFRTLCSGVLITPWWVLTAAHCFNFPGYTDRLNPYTTTVIIGRDDLESGHGETRTIIDPHPMYGTSHCPVGSDPSACDLALLKLGSPSTMSDADLADASVLSDWGEGTTARVYGYGVTAPGNALASRYLLRGGQVIDLFLGNHANLLASGIHSAPCKGDSGGPLIVSTSLGPRVVGTVETGDCVVGDAASYMKVGWRGTTANSPAFAWIQDVLH